MTLLRPLKPLLDRYFDDRRYRMSELQIVIAPPNSDGQIFHRDQYDDPGLTLILPLSAVNAQNGGTQLLCKTHKPISLLSNSYSKHTMSAKTGDICVMDSRVIHRGGENFTNRDRIILIVRFDLVGVDVPKNRGFGEITKVMYVRAVARTLEIINTVRNL